MKRSNASQIAQSDTSLQLFLYPKETAFDESKFHKTRLDSASPAGSAFRSVTRLVIFPQVLSICHSFALHSWMTPSLPGFCGNSGPQRSNLFG
jgi:hypothetical protein